MDEILQCGFNFESADYPTCDHSNESTPGVFFFNDTVCFSSSKIKENFATRNLDCAALLVPDKAEPRQIYSLSQHTSNVYINI